jgi:hypothetical protein
VSFVAGRLAAFLTAIILLALTGSSTFAQKNYDKGVTDNEIKIGNIMPYSGPASAWGVIGRTEAAYFRKDQCRRRHLRPQDPLHLLRRRLQPAESGRAGASSWRAMKFS